MRLLLALLPVAAAVPPNHGSPASLPPGCLPKDGQQDLFCPGEFGYGCFKIPSLLRIPSSGRLLAFIEARKYSCSDEGFVDLLLKTSDDGGRSWSQPTLVHTDSTATDWHTIGDALPLLDASGVVHLVFTRDNRDVFYTSSATAAKPGHLKGPEDWAVPRNISAAAVQDRSHFVGTGHAAGLVFTESPVPGAGTLLVPCYGGGSNSFVLASEDRGKSWHIRGELDAAPNEWVMTRVRHDDDERLFASLRNGNDDGHIPGTGHRLQSWSDDGGRSWANTTLAKELPEPLEGCEGSAVLHPNGKLYYAHPDPPNGLFRNDMNIKVSTDEGHTWAQHKKIWGPDAGCTPPCVPAASYSSMQVLGDRPDSEVALYYMRNNISMLIFEGIASYTTFAP